MPEDYDFKKVPFVGRAATKASKISIAKDKEEAAKKKMREYFKWAAEHDVDVPRKGTKPKRGVGYDELWKQAAAMGGRGAEKQLDAAVRTRVLAEQALAAAKSRRKK